VLSASVGRGVFGGARVLETRDKAGDAGVTASVYEWQYAEVTIGGGGGAPVGVLARTAGVRLRQTHALFVEAVEAEVETEGGIIADSRCSARDEGRAADMGDDSQEGEAGKDGGSGGARVMKLPACAA
jgi:hypothetical protein